MDKRDDDCVDCVSGCSVSLSLSHTQLNHCQQDKAELYQALQQTLTNVGWFFFFFFFFFGMVSGIKPGIEPGRRPGQANDGQADFSSMTDS